MNIGLAELLLFLFFPCTYYEAREVTLLTLLALAYFHEAMKLTKYQKDERVQSETISQVSRNQPLYIDQQTQHKLDMVIQEMNCIKEMMNRHTAYMKQMVDQEWANKEMAHASEVVNRDISHMKHMLYESMANQETAHQNIAGINASIKLMVNEKIASIQGTVCHLEKSIKEVQERQITKVDEPSLSALRSVTIEPCFKDHSEHPVGSLPRPPSTDSVSSDSFEIVDK